MAKRKIRKAARRVSKSPRNRTKQSRVISFFIGVATVAAIAFMIFQYAQSNNYKTVLGSQTHTVDPR